MDTFYEESFDGDAGSPVRAKAGFPEEDKIRSEEKRAMKWALRIIRRRMEIEGKKILDLRCRSGALSATLTAEGADVLSVDPFEANVRYAQQVRGLSHVVLLPFSRFHQLALLSEGEWDAVSVLTEHVLAHVASPQGLLTHIFALLKPGGYLFLDEKDVLLPARYQTRSVFDSGLAHQYHLTVDTTAGYLRSVGFELVECEIDTQRVSSHRHIRAVARKPEMGSAAVGAAPFLDGGPTAEEIRRRLRWLERTWRISRTQVVAKRTIRRLLRRLCSL
jgi:SAM-dependent methyltransferase